MKIFSDVPYCLVLFAAQSFGTTGPKRGNVQRFKRSVVKNCKSYDRTASMKSIWNLYEIYMKSMISTHKRVWCPGTRPQKSPWACQQRGTRPKACCASSGRKKVGHPTVDSLWLCGFQTMPFASYKSPSHYHQWVMIETYRNHQSHGGWFMPMDDHGWPPRGCHESRLMVTQAQEV